jgi:hypothetical protein
MNVSWHTVANVVLYHSWSEMLPGLVCTCCIMWPFMQKDQTYGNLREALTSALNCDKPVNAHQTPQGAQGPINPVGVVNSEQRLSFASDDPKQDANKTSFRGSHFQRACDSVRAPKDAEIAKLWPSPGYPNPLVNTRRACGDFYTKLRKEWDYANSHQRSTYWGLHSPRSNQRSTYCGACRDWERCWSLTSCIVALVVRCARPRWH